MPRGAYAEWSSWLSAFADGRHDGDASGLPPADPEHVGALAAARIAERAGAALNQRLDRWSADLSRDLRDAGGPQALRAALVAARHRLTPLRRLASCPLLYESLRQSLTEQLDAIVADAQKQLEAIATGQGGGDETLLRVVRHQPLTGAIGVDLPSGAPADPAPEAPSRRRVLL